MQRIINIKFYINKCNWEEINYPLEKNDWKKIEKNSCFWYFYNKKIYIYPAYVSKHNSNGGKPVILFMIPNEKGWN